MRSNKRKESLDDSSENILKYFNKKNVRFKEDFQSEPIPLERNLFGLLLLSVHNFKRKIRI